jgi:TetR/AcrR family tetracycline transcriptional repressor
MPSGLTKTAIVQAALDLLDEGGMDGLTVRALASRLGVQAPALYWHVRGKQALLDEMATQIWRRIADAMAGLPADLPWREVMAAYATTVRTELLGHRDGAKAFSGTTLTDPDVVRRQEVTFEHLIRQGLPLEVAVRGLVLLHYFTIGFCVEEQAVAQVTATGDDSYSPGRRAELIGPEAAPLAVEAGSIIFGDPDTRFTELLGLLLETIDRMRPAAGLSTAAVSSRRVVTLRRPGGFGPAAGTGTSAGPHPFRAPGQPPRVGQGAAQQELDLGAGAAQLLGAPSGQGVVDGWVQPQQQALALAHRVAGPAGPTCRGASFWPGLTGACALIAITTG